MGSEKEEWNDALEEEEQEEEEEVESLDAWGRRLLECNEKLEILVEIVGATNLNVFQNEDNDKKYNSYCEAFYRNKKVHRTSTVHGHNSPIFDIKTRSVFVFRTLAKELVDSEGLVFRVMEGGSDATFPQLSSRSTTIASVVVGPEMILGSCDERRLELELNGASESSQSGSSIAVRFRLATLEDLEFLSDMNITKQSKAGKVLITERSTKYAAGSAVASSISNIIKRGTSISDSMTKILVKPGPDPKNPSSTSFMTSARLKKTSLEASQKWIETGSKASSLGRIYLEIIRCNDLPNLDVGGVVGNLTDAFVTAVHEDAVLQTDVIDDSCGPIWMPWTQRAFIFNMVHPLSPLYLSVLDFDMPPLTPEGIGRVVINLNHFYPHRVYFLTYNLYQSSNISDREPVGTITIRLKIDIPDPYQYLLAANKQPPRFHINAKTQQTFQALQYTTYGKYQDDHFELKVMRSYINELFAYKSSISYTITDTLTSLIFWRGQVKFYSLHLPLHSLIAFLLAIKIVEHPHLLPPFCLFSTAWIMMASLHTRQKHPSPWSQPKPFSHYYSILTANKLPIPYKTIKRHQNAKHARAYENAWKRRLKTDEEKSEMQWQLQMQLDAIEHTAIHTETEGTRVDPLAAFLPILLRVQKRLSGYCHFCRKIKAIVTWEESLKSFWITLGSVLAGLISLILPWPFLIHWTARILIWTFLGPWMILVDIFILKNKHSIVVDEDEHLECKEHQIQDMLSQFQERSKKARLKGEKSIKLQAMRSLRFGTYSIKVPEWNVARHFDLPLEDSMAALPQQDDNSMYTLNEQPPLFVPGQRLHGSMIPTQKSSINSHEHNHALQDKMQKLAALHAAASTKHKKRKWTPRPLSPVPFEEIEVCPAGIRTPCSAENENAITTTRKPAFILSGKKLELIPFRSSILYNSPQRNRPSFDNFPSSPLITTKLTEEEMTVSSLSPMTHTTVSTPPHNEEGIEVEEEGLEVINWDVSIGNFTSCKNEHRPPLQLMTKDVNASFIARLTNNGEKGEDGDGDEDSRGLSHVYPSSTSDSVEFAFCRY